MPRTPNAPPPPPRDEPKDERAPLHNVEISEETAIVEQPTSLPRTCPTLPDHRCNQIGSIVMYREAVDRATGKKFWQHIPARVVRFKPEMGEGEVEEAFGGGHFRAQYRKRDGTALDEREFHFASAPKDFAEIDRRQRNEDGMDDGTGGGGRGSGGGGTDHAPMVLTNPDGSQDIIPGLRGPALAAYIAQRERIRESEAEKGRLRAELERAREAEKTKASGSVLEQVLAAEVARSGKMTELAMGGGMGRRDDGAMDAMREGMAGLREALAAANATKTELIAAGAKREVELIAAASKRETELIAASSARESEIRREAEKALATERSLRLGDQQAHLAELRTQAANHLGEMQRLEAAHRKEMDGLRERLEGKVELAESKADARADEIFDVRNAYLQAANATKATSDSVEMAKVVQKTLSDGIAAFRAGGASEEKIKRLEKLGELVGDMRPAELQQLQDMLGAFRGAGGGQATQTQPPPQPQAPPPAPLPPPPPPPQVAAGSNGGLAPPPPPPVTGGAEGELPLPG